MLGEEEEATLLYFSETHQKMKMYELSLQYIQMLLIQHSMYYTDRENFQMYSNVVSM